MSRKRCLNCFGEAVCSDESFARDTWEWKRRVQRDGNWQEVMCNPEDVRPSPLCAHDANTVCSSCRIPICNDCWRHSMRNESIPKALTNDNFLGYLHRYFVEHLVRAMGLPERGISSSCAMGAGSGQGKGGSAGARSQHQEIAFRDTLHAKSFPLCALQTKTAFLKVFVSLPAPRHLRKEDPYSLQHVVG